MFNSPYETTICKRHVLAEVIEAIDRNIVATPDDIKKADFDGRAFRFFLGLITPKTTNIPPFGHPIILVHPVNGDQIVELRDAKSSIEADIRTYVDVRNFTRLTRDGEIEVTSKLDYEVALYRGALSAWWAMQPTYDLLGLGNFQVTMFTRWIVEQLNRKLALPSETQLLATIITAYYYLCLFVEEDTLREEDKIKMAKQIASSTFFSVEQVLNVIEPLPLLNDIQAYTDALVNHTESIRFERFNPVLLYGILGNSWFGLNSKEMVAVAIEHPPTFIAMLYAAAKEYGYRNTIIGRVIHDNAKRGTEDQFCKAVDRLLSQE